MLKVTLRHATKAERGGGSLMYGCTLSLTSALDVCGWSAPHPAALLAGTRHRTNCTGGWVGPSAPHGRFRQVYKILPYPRFDLRTV
jgi:hypothetical protein